MNFKDNLKKVRKDNNLSQEELAEKLNVTRQSVSKWESGAAYPEMDKVLQICKMFNVNIDDLLNKDIKEVNATKESKININKYIDDFFGYVTKFVNTFSSMKFKDKIKCIIEQLFIILVLFIILAIIGGIGSSIVSSIFSFLPYRIYNIIHSILGGLYTLISVIIIVILISHIFKIRYLDYYEIVEDTTEEVEEKVVENNNIVKEKIIIRDPKHSSYGFVKGLAKCILFIIKFIVFWIMFSLAFPLIGLSMVSILSFIFMKSGLIFIGMLIILVSCIVINIDILAILYNFIFNKKSNFKVIGITVLLSLITIGIGSGLFTIGMKDIRFISEVDDVNIIEKDYMIDMQDNLKIINNCCYIEYVEVDRNDIKIEVVTTKYNDVNVTLKGNVLSFETDYHDFMYIVKNIIDDVNNKTFIDYSDIHITIYTSKENIDKLKVR